MTVLWLGVGLAHRTSGMRPPLALTGIIMGGQQTRAIPGDRLARPRYRSGAQVAGLPLRSAGSNAESLRVIRLMLVETTMSKLLKAYDRSRVPLYIQVASVMRQRIEAKQWRPGEKI